MLILSLKKLAVLGLTVSSLSAFAYATGGELRVQRVQTPLKVTDLQGQVSNNGSPANIQITGAAAEVLFNAMKNVDVKEEQTDDSESSSRSGQSLYCAKFRGEFSCHMYVDGDGAIHSGSRQ